MSVRDWAVYVLVWSGVVTQLLCCLGLVVMRNVYDRIHFVTASTVPAFLIATAILIREDWTQPAINALVAAAFLFVLNPVLATAAARAARARELGQVEATPDERPRGR